MQIIYTVSLGYLFVPIFYKSGALMSCIILIAVFNQSTDNINYLTLIVLIIIPFLYSIYK